MKKIVLPSMSQSSVVVESPGSLTPSEVDRRAQYAHYDLKGELCGPFLSDIGLADLVQCIYKSLEYNDLVTLRLKT